MRRTSRISPRPPPNPEEEDEGPRFWAADSHSVQTTRQFSLLRGKPIKSALDILQAENSRRRRRFSEDSGLEVSPPPEDEEGAAAAAAAVSTKPIPQAAAPQSTVPKPQTSSALSNFIDKAKAQQFDWNWPLGAVRITNSDGRFEIRVPIGPFRENEVWANIVGNELTIRLDATDRLDQGCTSRGKNRYIQRKYTLPLNVEPHTADFKVVNKDTFRVSMQKDRPVQLALAAASGGRR